MINADRIKRLRLLRAEHGWTQAEAAKRISKEGYNHPVSIHTVRAWEYRKRTIPGWAVRLLELAVDNADQ